jgi:hypothetical protein
MGWDIRRICLRSDPTNILRCWGHLRHFLLRPTR